MNYNYYIADVFTDQVFNGAQVGVFPDADGLNKQQMKRVARELNLSETVFIFHQEQPAASKRMRIFSPRGEIDFAGHPIIAAAFVLTCSGGIELSEGNTPLVLEQNSGSINANITIKEGKAEFVQFSNRVAPIVDYFAPTEAELARFLSINQAHIDSKKYNTRLVSCGLPFLVVPVYYYQTVREAKFDYSAWSQSIAPQTAAQEILLFSTKTTHTESDFHVRLVGPKIGPQEDPPVGSAMPAFAAYLSSFDHLRKGTYSFVVDRGDDKIRRSVLNLEMDHKGEEKLTLRVGGEAVMVAQGSMTIPEGIAE